MMDFIGANSTASVVAPAGQALSSIERHCLIDYYPTLQRTLGCLFAANLAAANRRFGSRPTHRLLLISCFGGFGLGFGWFFFSRLFEAERQFVLSWINPDNTKAFSLANFDMTGRVANVLV